MDNKVLLVDGHSIVFRAYYGQARNGSLNAPDGTPTGAVYTFLNMLSKYILDYEPTHMVILFDESDPTFRTQTYTAYKANRSSMPEDLVAQMPILFNILDAMNVKTLSLPGFEADDLIGTLANRFASEDSHVYILSGDRDDLQLVNKHVSQIYPHQRGKTSVFTPDLVLEEYELYPKQIIDLKALMGDSADNIPGVKGVGVKTATKLLKEYTSLENIYENIDEIKGSVKNKLIIDKENAFISYELATIDCDVEIDCELDDALRQDYDSETLTELLVKLGFTSMIDKFGLHKEAHELLDQSISQFNLNYPNLFDLENLKEELSSKDSLAINLKKDEDYYTVAIAADEDLVHVLGLSRDELVELLEYLIQKEVVLISYDFKPIFKELEFYPLKGIFDISVAAYLLGLEVDGKSQSELYASIMPLNQANFRIENLPKDKELSKSDIEFFNLTMAINDVFENLNKDMSERNLHELAETFEFPLVSVLAKMESTGIKLDVDILSAISDEFTTQITELESNIYELAGHEFNINSSKQLADVLYNELGIQSGKKTSTGALSTAASVLEDLALTYPIVKDVLRYRKLTKLQSTFTDGLAKEVQEDGRIHSTFHQKLTTTGRLSSSDPNMQNIPNRGEDGRQIRKAFVASPGYVFLDADYSQIELRLLAVLSQDEELLRSYREGEDIHRRTAASIFDIEVAEVSPTQRDVAKTINFSIIYGISDFGLSQDLKITVADAKEYIESYYELFDSVRPYMDKQIAFAYENGYVETYFGRRRYIEELKDKNYNRRKFGERVAMNSPIQGTAADIMKLAMIRMQRLLNESELYAKILIQVHDEILIEAREEDQEQVKDMLKDAMENVVELEIPLEVEIGVGKNWYESK